MLIEPHLVPVAAFEERDNRVGAVLMGYPMAIAKRATISAIGVEVGDLLAARPGQVDRAWEQFQRLASRGGNENQDEEKVRHARPYGPAQPEEGPRR